MSRWDLFLTAWFAFWNRLWDEIDRHRRNQSQQRLDTDAADIDDDPYGYALREYGGRLPDAAPTADAAAPHEADQS